MLMSSSQNQNGDNMPNFYTVQDLSSRWKRSVETIRRYIREGKLEAKYIGGYLIPREVVEDFEREQTKKM